MSITKSYKKNKYNNRRTKNKNRNRNNKGRRSRNNNNKGRRSRNKNNKKYTKKYRVGGDMTNTMTNIKRIQNEANNASEYASRVIGELNLQKMGINPKLLYKMINNLIEENHEHENILQLFEKLKTTEKFLPESEFDPDNGESDEENLEKIKQSINSIIDSIYSPEEKEEVRKILYDFLDRLEISIDLKGGGVQWTTDLRKPTTIQSAENNTQPQKVEKKTKAKSSSGPNPDALGSFSFKIRGARFYLGRIAESVKNIDINSKRITDLFKPLNGINLNELMTSIGSYKSLNIDTKELYQIILIPYKCSTTISKFLNAMKIKVAHYIEPRSLLDSLRDAFNTYYDFTRGYRGRELLGRYKQRIETRTTNRQEALEIADQEIQEILEPLKEMMNPIIEAVKEFSIENLRFVVDYIKNEILPKLHEFLNDRGIPEKAVEALNSIKGLFEMISRIGNSFLELVNKIKDIGISNLEPLAQGLVFIISIPFRLLLR